MPVKQLVRVAVRVVIRRLLGRAKFGAFASFGHLRRLASAMFVCFRLRRRLRSWRRLRRVLYDIVVPAMLLAGKQDIQVTLREGDEVGVTEAARIVQYGDDLWCDPEQDHVGGGSPENARRRSLAHRRRRYGSIFRVTLQP